MRDARLALPFGALVIAQLAVAAAVAASAGGYDAAPAAQQVVAVGLLAPLELLGVWWLGYQLGGRPLAIAAGLALVLLPPAGLLYAQSKFDATYRERVLTEVVGLAGGGRLAAACGLAIAAAALVYALRSRTELAALAGLLAGLASVADASAALFFAGAALACLVVRDLRAAAFLLTGALVPLAVVVLTNEGVHLDASWQAFSANMADLREYLWSNRLLQWLPLAGVVAVWRRSTPAAAILGGWFAAWVAVIGASPHLPVATGDYLVAWQPMLPAFALFVAGLPLLLPTLATRLDDRLAARPS